MINPRFFKESSNENAAEFRKCLPVNVNTSYRTLAPAIATAEEHWVKPMIGIALFDEMATYYAGRANDNASPVKDELLGLLQMAVVRLAYWDSFDQLQVVMSDNGIRDVNKDERAYRYQSDALRSSLLRQGYAFLNQAIGFCMSHISELSSFSSSEYYSDRTNSIIRTMQEFDKVTSIGGDFYVFARLRDKIAETESMELPYRIGKSLTLAMTNDRDNPRFSAVKSGVMSFVAHWTMAEAIPFMNMMFTSRGLVVVSEESTGSNSGIAQNTPRPEQIAGLVEKHRQSAERSIGQVVSYMKGHIGEFPEINEIGMSTQFEHTAEIRDNRGKKTFFV